MYAVGIHFIYILVYAVSRENLNTTVTGFLIFHILADPRNPDPINELINGINTYIKDQNVLIYIIIISTIHKNHTDIYNINQNEICNTKIIL